MTWLCALLPAPLSSHQETVLLPEFEPDATPRPMRRSHRQIRPVQVMSAAVSDLPVLTLQDPVDVAGARVFPVTSSVDTTERAGTYD